MKAFDVISICEYCEIVPNVGRNWNAENQFGTFNVVKGAELLTKHIEFDVNIDLHFDFIWIWLNKDHNWASKFDEADIILQPISQPDTRVFIYKWE